MKTPLAPGIKLMNRLTYPHKFALIGTLFALPLSLVVYFLVNEMNKGIDFASKEVVGNEYLRPVIRLIESMQVHRGKTYIAEPVNGDAAQAAAVVEPMEESIRAVDAVDRKLGSVLRTTDQWMAIKGKCRVILSDVSSKSREEQFEEKTVLINDMILLMAQAGDQSNLILDPDLDSYYLMETVVNRLILLAEAIGQARARLTATATSPSESEVERLTLSNLANSIRTTQTALTRNFNVAFRETHDTKLELRLEPHLKKSLAATARFLELLDRRTMTGVAQDPEECWTAGTDAIRAGFELYDESSFALDTLLNARIAGFERNKVIVAVVTLPCVLTALYLFVAFYRAVMGTVLKLEETSQRMLNGDMDDTELLLDSHDELAHVTKAFGALTNRLRTECAALKQSEMMTRLIIDTALDAVITMDARGKITGWNAQAEATFGWPRGEVLGRVLGEVIIPRNLRDAHSRGIDRFLATGETSVLNRRIEVTALHRDGHEFPVEVAVSPARAGDSYVFSAFLRDITARRQAEAELQQAKTAAEAANRAKSDFLANMSHEIRTPMNGILGMTELALDTELSREQREYLELVKYSANSLLTVINDILDFSKIEAGKLLLDPVPFDLADCVADTMKTMGVRAHQKGLELVQHVHPDVPEAVVGDMARVRQVLVNLVGNALKFTERGEVLVRVEPESRTEDEIVLHFSVTDSGIGIPPEKLKSIFHAFEQADGSITRKYGGTGLGLSISSQLIGLMGGRIWVESEVGHGSTFHFTIAFGAHQGRLSENVRRSPDSLHELPVLIVDDNATNRRILELVTTNWRMKPTLAESGVQALALLDRALERDEPFGLVLLDAQMPGMDGFTLAEGIKQRVEMSRATIMMLSSAAQLGDAQRCRQMGLAGYLTKPVKQSELLDAILDAMNPADEPAAESAPKAAAPTTDSGKSIVAGPRSWRILLAEDNLVNQRVAVRTLERMGHSVTVVSNGSEAIAALERERFDLLLSDVQMPVMDGLEATKAIRHRERFSGAHLPIIAMTAHAMKGDREECLNAGMDAYTSKPILPKELGEAIENVMTRFGRPATSASTVTNAAATNLPPNEPATKNPGDAPPDRKTIAVVDMQALLERLGGDPSLLVEIIGIYLQDGPRLLDEIREAIAARDPQKLAIVAHQYKGTVLNLNARPAADAAAKLEQLGRSSSLDGVADVWADLEREAVALESALTQLKPVGAST
jgi:PAS domain S-box-containing protein